MKTIEKALKRIPPQIYLCFAATFVFGFFIHMYMFTNKIPNVDDLTAYANTGADLSSGRWFINFAGGLSGVWSIPWINGMMGLLYLSCSACAIAALLDFKSRLSMILLAFTLVSFPSVTSIYAYMFTADVYFLAVFLNCLGAFLVYRYKYGFLYASILFALGLGIYQSFICFAAGLMFLVSILDLCKGKAISDVTRGFIKCIIGLILGLLLYFFVLNILLKTSGTELNVYQGINEIGKFQVHGIIYYIAKAYAKIIAFFTIMPEAFYQTPIIATTNILVVTGLIILFFSYVFRNKIYKDNYRFSLLLLSCFFFPLATSSIYVMAPKAWVHLIMKYQYCLIYVFLIALIELHRTQYTVPVSKMRRILYSIMIGGLLIINYNNYLIANKTYYLMENSYERACTFLMKLSLRIEEFDVYEKNYKVALIGSANSNVIFEDSQLEQEVSGIVGYTMAYSFLNQFSYENFLRTRIGMNVSFADPEELADIVQSSNWQSMSCYPNSGSIRIINDICVVKMSEQG